MNNKYWDDENVVHTQWEKFIQLFKKRNLKLSKIMGGFGEYYIKWGDLDPKRKKSHILSHTCVC